jgi:hypothetical protein
LENLMPPRPWHAISGDAGLTALLTAQCFITFIAIPVMATGVAGRWLLDVCHFGFAALCAVALTRRPEIRALFVAGLVVLAVGPRLLAHMGLIREFTHETISCSAFVFNLLITVLVARRAFGDGHVTGHRLQGAVLVYLNTAALFAIAYDMLDAVVHGAIARPGGSLLGGLPGARVAELSYFSLATITTAGYGDLVPVHPLARSLANLEAVFGQLFPATMLARLVALHLAHGERVKRSGSR